MECYNRNCGSISEVANECCSDDAIVWDNCTGRVKTKHVVKENLMTIGWQDVLYCHTFGVLTMYRFHVYAKELGYLFFCWNDRIYFTCDGADTNMTNKDVR